MELASGTGRLAFGLLREGAEYTGLEIVPAFVDSAVEKLLGYGDALSIINGDMRSFSLDKKFDLIFIGYNSFLHLLTDEDAYNCLQCVKFHMHEKSRFMIDIYIPNPLFLYRPEGFRFSVLEYTESKSGEKIFVEESNEYNTETEVNEITWYYSTKSKKDYYIGKFSVRMYFPSKMNQILIDAGFKIIHQWGDYYRTDMGDGSKLQIYDTCLV